MNEGLHAIDNQMSEIPDRTQEAMQYPNDTVAGIVLNAANESRRETHTDTLTGLDLRKPFEEKLTKAIENLNSGATILILAMDVNRFKGVNDTHGHFVGDKLLSSIGETLPEANRGILEAINATLPEAFRRETDTYTQDSGSSRQGGDEFLTFCVIDTNGKTNLRHVNDLNKIIEAESKRVNGILNSKLAETGDPRLTGDKNWLSIGGAIYISGDTAESMIKRAYNKMEELKEAGKEPYTDEELSILNDAAEILATRGRRLDDNSKQQIDKWKASQANPPLKEMSA